MLDMFFKKEKHFTTDYATSTVTAKHVAYT
jgi:hypothetical protein